MIVFDSSEQLYSCFVGRGCISLLTPSCPRESVPVTVSWRFTVVIWFLLSFSHLKQITVLWWNSSLVICFLERIPHSSFHVRIRELQYLNHQWVIFSCPPPTPGFRHLVLSSNMGDVWDRTSDSVFENIVGTPDGVIFLLEDRVGVAYFYLVRNWKKSHSEFYSLWGIFYSWLSFIPRA